MDKIIIKDAVYTCNLGITPKERALKQIVVVTIQMNYDTSKPALSDSIHETIDYSLINKKIKVLLESKDYYLIETVAESIAHLVLDNYPVNKISVLVKKPYALKNADCAAVEIVREK